jgi:hypothetical protein
VPLADTTASAVESSKLDTVRAVVVPGAVPEPEAQAPRLVRLPYVKPQIQMDIGPRPVPDVAGLPLRAAVRALHQAGFRVTLAPQLATPTEPSAGTVLPSGSIVKLQHTQ